MKGRSLQQGNQSNYEDIDGFELQNESVLVDFERGRVEEEFEEVRGQILGSLIAFVRC